MLERDKKIHLAPGERFSFRRFLFFDNVVFHSGAWQSTKQASDTRAHSWMQMRFWCLYVVVQIIPKASQHADGLVYSVRTYVGWQNSERQITKHVAIALFRSDPKLLQLSTRTPCKWHRRCTTHCSLCLREFLQKNPCNCSVSWIRKI